MRTLLEGIMTYDWMPLVRVGMFEFGKPVQEYVDRHVLEMLPCEEDGTNWETYIVPGDSLRVHVENSRVISIACYDECILRGINLIGLDFAEAKRHIGSEPSDPVNTIYIDEEPQEVFEFDDVEAQLWVKDGKVVTVFCGCSS